MKSIEEAKTKWMRGQENKKIGGINNGRIQGTGWRKQNYRMKRKRKDIRERETKGWNENERILGNEKQRDERGKRKGKDIRKRKTKGWSENERILGNEKQRDEAKTKGYYQTISIERDRWSNQIERSRTIEIQLSKAIEFQSNITPIFGFHWNSIGFDCVRVRSIAFDWIRLHSIVFL